MHTRKIFFILLVRINLYYIKECCISFVSLQIRFRYKTFTLIPTRTNTHIPLCRHCENIVLWFSFFCLNCSHNARIHIAWYRQASSIHRTHRKHFCKRKQENKKKKKKLMTLMKMKMVVISKIVCTRWNTQVVGRIISNSFSLSPETNTANLIL